MKHLKIKISNYHKMISKIYLDQIYTQTVLQLINKMLTTNNNNIPGRNVNILKFPIKTFLVVQ
jgi:hypothetical protein